MNTFAEIEFICWENGAWQGCSERVNVDISGFDSTLTVPLKSNWYYTDEDNGKYSVDFWDDEIWEDNRQKYTGFSAEDNNYYSTSSNSGVASGIAFFNKIDAAVSTLEDANGNQIYYSADVNLILRIYAFVGNTKLNVTKENGEFTISKTGTNLSSIQFGTNSGQCLFTQTGETDQATNVDTFTLNFSTCPIQVNAVDPISNQTFVYTSNFDGLSKTFTCDENEGKGSKGEVERPLFNSEGKQIGFVIFDFFSNKFRVVDLNKQAFTKNVAVAPE